MQRIAELPAHDLITIELQLDRLIPEGQRAFLEARSQYDVAHMLLLDGRLGVVDRLHQAGVLRLLEFGSLDRVRTLLGQDVRQRVLDAVRDVTVARAIDRHFVVVLLFFLVN